MTKLLTPPGAVGKENMLDSDKADIAKLLKDAIDQLPTPTGPVPVTPVPGPTPVPVTPIATTLDWTKLIGIIFTAIMSALAVYHQQTTEIKPQPAPVPAVTVADPAVQNKLVSDVADLQARVKVLETPVKK